MDPVVALLPSVFLGPAVWEPVADRLREHGVRTALPSPPPIGTSTPLEVLGWLAAALPSDSELVLVPHSNAGLYVPQLATQHRVTGYVFVDAILPPSTGGQFPVAPPALAEMLRETVDPDGLLPPWTGWWSAPDLDGLFPDEDTRRRVETGQPRLPYDYLLAPVDIPAGWDTDPGRYVAFGDAYADEAADAAARGWPVSRLPGRHLHMLHDPDTVAREILTALGRAPATPAPTAT
ncbi:hypothetical protein [Plantactinospora sp. GCM10030261]|uniref:hypothetical protein n=1 Tax=Plantactinospora sp. GCM10030261 TaxID=3273420 RepID=UPI0036239ED1